MVPKLLISLMLTPQIWSIFRTAAGPTSSVSAAECLPDYVFMVRFSWSDLLLSLFFVLLPWISIGYVVKKFLIVCFQDCKSAWGLLFWKLTRFSMVFPCLTSCPLYSVLTENGFDAYLKGSGEPEICVLFNITYMYVLRQFLRTCTVTLYMDAENKTAMMHIYMRS